MRRKKMSKKLFQILAVLMVFALLSGCVVPTPAAPAEEPVAEEAPAEEPAAEEAAAEPEGKGEIVFIPKSTSATFYLFLVKGAQDKAEELGYTIDYLGPATEADIAAQVDLVRNVTKKKPAGILLAALDSEALIAPVEEAMAAGVPVVMVDSGINSDVPVASIITDQYAGGFMAGEEMARLLGEEGLVADHGIQAGSVSAGRSTGFQEAIAQYANMEALETQWTDADATKSMNITSDELTAHPELAGVFNACGASTGDAEAVKSKGLAEEVKIVAFDPSPEVLPLFDEGTIQAIIAQDPYQMGYEGVAALDAFINGETIENPNVELAPVLITPENYDTDVVQALLQTPDKFEK
jgi:ribose transport system substrate-binding protein